MRALGVRFLDDQGNELEGRGRDLTRVADIDVSRIHPEMCIRDRLQTAKIALGLLLCEDEGEADRMAEELKALNDQRKDMTQEGIEQAAAMVDELYREDKVLVVFLPDCHESVSYTPLNYFRNYLYTY